MYGISKKKFFFLYIYNFFLFFFVIIIDQTTIEIDKFLETNHCIALNIENIL